MKLLVAPPDQIGMSDLLELCDCPAQSSAISNRAVADLNVALYGSRDLNTLRVKYALALWCLVSLLYPCDALPLTPSAARVLFGKSGDTRQSTASAGSNQAERACHPDAAFVIVADPGAGGYVCVPAWTVEDTVRLTRLVAGSHDLRVVQSLIASYRRIDVSMNDAAFARLAQLASGQPSGAGDQCLACRQIVSEGDASGVCRCPKGHEWSACSLSFLLCLSQC